MSPDRYDCTEFISTLYAEGNGIESVKFCGWNTLEEQGDGL